MIDNNESEISKLKQELDKEKLTSSRLRELLQNPPPDVQECVMDKLGIRDALADWSTSYYELLYAAEDLIKSYHECGQSVLLKSISRLEAVISKQRKLNEYL